MTKSCFQMIIFFKRQFIDFAFDETLRDLISKIGQIVEYTFLGIFPVWCQNQNILWKCTEKHLIFWPECKTRVSVSISSFGPKVKMSWLSSNIFSTFFQFSLLLDHSPIMVVLCLDRTGRFYSCALTVLIRRTFPSSRTWLFRALELGFSAL